MQDEKKEKVIKITPLKNFVINFNEIHIELIEGVEAEIPEFLKQNMLTENVIKKETETKKSMRGDKTDGKG